AGPVCNQHATPVLGITGRKVTEGALSQLRGGAARPTAISVRQCSKFQGQVICKGSRREVKISLGRPAQIAERLLQRRAAVSVYTNRQSLRVRLKAPLAGR